MKKWLGALALCLLAEWAWIFRPLYRPNWDTARDAVVMLTVDATSSITVLPSTTPVVMTARFFGTGFVVTPDGYVITCAHVVSPVVSPGAVDIKVSFYGIPGAYAKPTVVYRNDFMDIALLKLSIPVPLTFLRLGSGEEAKVGDKLKLIGHPRVFGWTMADNQLTGKRFIMGLNAADPSIPAEQYVFQLNHPIAQGASGGPLMDEKGKVVCMLHMGYYTKGAAINFCVPVEEIKWVLETQGVQYNSWRFLLH